MGHLGQGTPITTVQDKEIVLTASDGQTFKMKVTDLAEAVRQVMPVATVGGNGLQSSGFVASYTVGNTDKKVLIIKYKNSSNYITLLRTGDYSAPSLYSINIGMGGGANSGTPVSLNVKLISGPSVILSANVFVRDKKDYVELEYRGSIVLAWCDQIAIDFNNGLLGISIQESDRYNSITDSNLLSGTIVS